MKTLGLKTPGLKTLGKALALAAAVTLGASVQAADAPAPAAAKKQQYYEFVLGNPNAKLTVVEYASVTCPHCAKFFTESFPILKKDYIDTGKIKYVYRDLPTPPRELSFAASQLARCVPNNKGMNMIEMLFKNQEAWMSAPETTLRGYAQLAGMSSADFDACLKNQALYKELNDAVDRATTVYKVESTPTFFVGETKIGGEQWEPLKKAIDKALQ